MSFYGTAHIINLLNESGESTAITTIPAASRVILHNTGEAVGQATVNGATISVAPGCIIELDNNDRRTFAVTNYEGAGMQVTAIS